jgi:hypothetical protein
MRKRWACPRHRGQPRIILYEPVTGWTRGATTVNRLIMSIAERTRVTSSR